MFEELQINDCWKKIGVWGDSTCPELKEHGHCRNCPVYSSAAAQLLNGTPPSRYLEEWTSLVARKREVEDSNTHSVVIFCIGSEWLALSIKIFKEVANAKTIHSLPHRRQGIVLGLVNVRGELLVCVSLARALGLEKAEASRDKKRVAQQRLLVLNDEGKRLVFPVDEVGGIHHYRPKDIHEIPSTLAGKVATHTAGILSWQKKTVGRLDDQLLLYTLNKDLS